MLSSAGILGSSTCATPSATSEDNFRSFAGLRPRDQHAKQQHPHQILWPEQAKPAREELQGRGIRMHAGRSNGCGRIAVEP